MRRRVMIEQNWEQKNNRQNYGRELGEHETIQSHEHENEHK